MQIVGILYNYHKYHQFDKDLQKFSLAIIYGVIYNL